MKTPYTPILIKLKNGELIPLKDYGKCKDGRRFNCYYKKGVTKKRKDLNTQYS